MAAPVIVPLTPRAAGEPAIEAHGQPIAAITLRPMTGGDLAACGYPLITMAGMEVPDGVVTDGGDQAPPEANEEMRPNAAAITKLISRLGNVPLSTVKSLDAVDWNNCMAAVLGFLVRAKPAKASSTPVSTSHGNGSSTQDAS